MRNIFLSVTRVSAVLLELLLLYSWLDSWFLDALESWLSGKQHHVLDIDPEHIRPSSKLSPAFQDSTYLTAIVTDFFKRPANSVIKPAASGWWERYSKTPLHLPSAKGGLKLWGRITKIITPRTTRIRSPNTLPMGSCYQSCQGKQNTASPWMERGLYSRKKRPSKISFMSGQVPSYLLTPLLQVAIS